MAPEYVKAANKLHPLVPTYAVDCDDEKNKPLCAQQQVQGFPTVKVCRITSVNLFLTDEVFPLVISPREQGSPNDVRIWRKNGICNLQLGFATSTQPRHETLESW